MSWFNKPEKKYQRKPPVVRAFQFEDAEDCQAQYHAEQFGSCFYSEARQYKPSATFEFAHDQHMDWVEATVFHDGKKVKASHKGVSIPVGWWIVIDDSEDTVEFIPDHKFKARYQEVSE